MKRQRQLLNKQSFDFMTQLAVKILIISYLLDRSQFDCSSLSPIMAQCFLIQTHQECVRHNKMAIFTAMRSIYRSKRPPRNSMGSSKKETMFIQTNLFQFHLAHRLHSLQLTNMKWITLKSKNLPIIALETDRAIEVFTGLTQKAQISQSQVDLTQLELLKQDFHKRIHQLDTYYREHCLDQNISIFHMFKMKLTKAIFVSNRKIEKAKTLSKNQSFQKLDEPLFPIRDIKMLDQPLFTYYQSNLKKTNSSQGKSNKGPKNQEQFISQVKNKKNDKKMPKTSLKYEKINKQKQEKQNQFVRTPTSKGMNRQISKTNMQKLKKMENIIGNIGNLKKSKDKSDVVTPDFHSQFINPSTLLDEMKLSSELTFTIKMTKQQYKSLLLVKNQMKKQ